MLIKRIILIILFLASILNAENKKDIEKEIIKYVKKGSVVVATLKGEKLFDYNSDEKYVPASTQKVIIALVAIDLFGLNYRFFTDIFVNNKNDILIKGYGDPFFISEDFNKIISQFKTTYKFSEINNIYLDDSFFEGDLTIPGSEYSLNPYEAPVSAISLNFNTILLKRENNKIISGEEETPMLEFTEKIIKELNVQIKKNGDLTRINLGKNRDNPPLYFGEMLTYFLKKEGIKINGKIEKKLLDKEFKNLFRYYSDKTLYEILKAMLEHSNNFITNQIFLCIGSYNFKKPKTDLKSSTKFINEYLKEKYLLTNTGLVEGSGLSRDNFTTANDLLKIMIKFFQYKELMRYNKIKNYYYKTGTLKDNNSIVGFYQSEKDNEWKIFIVLLNQVERNRNKIVEIILDNY
ncbi:MAG TPA: D-alanyl-D-alanine carboxypeptidase [bacterium]|nr:D-alanyl-D-alanine carboxypeptidase [bacterium]HOL48474.1 D-alanyl-D-alanine carboxypeptidase [bacterium]HPQ19991.1 D-alanyl-D-alanine carboxypeptidase [bacterium]